MDLTFGAALLALNVLSAPPPQLAAVATAQPARLSMLILQDRERIAALASPAIRPFQTDASNPERRSWIQRHPSCFGAIIGFAGGFLIGFLPGDDAVFDDYVAVFNGAVLGGIGAGTGAILGWLQSRK